ncbi:MAG: hypothetical protein KIT84_37680 [Labilithrix sp.]|nr:hypothetical protein [Labilithrix sp.]MCW5816789.1 hypothetical protein [Labilithrix sp.]
MSIRIRGRLGALVIVGLTAASCSSETSSGDDAGTPAASPTSGVTVGGACTRDGELRCGSGADGKTDGSILSCANGAYEKVFACPGLQECRDVATITAVRCGTDSANVDFAKEGAPCGGEGAAVCSFDRKTVHWCVGGTWVVAQHCPPSDCTKHNTGGQPFTACTNGGITPGDMCKTDLAGGVTCSTDLRSLLGCQNGRAVVVEECQAPKECSVTDTGARGCL